MGEELFRTGRRIEELIEIRRRRVQDSLQRLSAAELRGTDVDDLVSAILAVGLIRVPVLRRDQERLRPPETFQKQPPRPNDWDSRDGSGPPAITVYRFVREVPFDGEGEVFGYAHTPAVPSIPATAELETLYVKHETSVVDRAAIVAQLDAYCDQVARVLVEIQGEAERWNITCERWVREEVDKKVEELRNADAVVAAVTGAAGATYVAAEPCDDVAALAAPLMPGITEPVRRKLIAGLERGALKILDDAEPPLAELRVEIAKKAQARGGVADRRLARFHLRVREQCLQHVWAGLLKLRADSAAPPAESEEVLARVMACYVDQLLSRIVEMVNGDRVGSGAWNGARTVQDTAQRWKASCAADARDTMSQVIAAQQVKEAARGQATATKPTSFDFGIVTALPIEYAAVKAMMAEVYSVAAPPRDPNHYEAGFIDGTHGRQHVVVTLAPKMGTNAAATTASTLMTTFNPRYLLMVGIAGGIPNAANVTEHVRLGDVVISNEAGLIQHDNVKLEDGNAVVRDNSARPSAALVQKAKVLVANAYAGSRPWDGYADRAAQTIGKCARPADDTDVLYGGDDAQIPHPEDSERLRGRSKILIGRIASGNMLLRDANHRDELRRRHGVLAVEMEGSGIGDAAWQSNGRFLIIRGISDYSDSHKTDLWQGYAAAAAGAVARSLIELF